jgi:hypothetical protein
VKLGGAVESLGEFQKILDHRGHAPLSPLYPLANLGMARAATLAGNVIKNKGAAGTRAHMILPGVGLSAYSLHASLGSEFLSKEKNHNGNNRNV